MPGIDKNLAFYPLGIAVLTISDTRTLDTDTSGGLLVERLTAARHKLLDRALVKDDIPAIRAQVQCWLKKPEIEIILTTGGTGFSPRDNTPEAIKPLNLPEAIEAALLRNTGPHAPFLNLAVACESSDQDQMEAAAARCGIEIDDVNAKHFEALAWVHAIDYQ